MRNQYQCKMLVKEDKEYSWRHTELDIHPTEIPSSLPRSINLIDDS